MANETYTCLIGNMTGAPEIRFTPSGAAVLNGTIACTPRVFDRNANEWKDGETLFARFSLWREQAENAAESLQKGTRVIAWARTVQNNWEDKDGNKRSSIEYEIEEIGPSLRYATARAEKVSRNGQQQAGYGGQQQGGGYGGQQQGGGYGGQQQGGWPQQAPQQGGQQWGGYGNGGR